MTIILTFWDLPKSLKIYRFRRIAFGVVSSPFLLTAVIRYHSNIEVQGARRKGKFEEAETLQQLYNQVYVDNLITRCDTPDKFSYLHELVKRVFKKASFNMQTWASNIPQIGDLIPKDDLNEARTQKVLGLTWQLDKDELQLYFIKNPRNNEKATKQTILSRLAQNYDPLGLDSAS